MVKLKVMGGAVGINKSIGVAVSRGFTLLELMIALVIFALLTVFGWQSFNGLMQTKNRVDAQSVAVSDLQYAYLQIQNDMAQVVAFEDQKGQSLFSIDSGSDTVGMQFVRYADPDPRYASTPNLILVNYFVADGALMRKQSYQLPTVSADNTTVVDTDVGISSVLLNNITDYKIQPLYMSKNGGNATGGSLVNQPADKQNQALPQGVSMAFGWQDVPIVWQFVLPNPKVAIEQSLNNESTQAE